MVRSRLTLKALRESRHLSIRDLADQAGLSYAHLHKIESGKVSPSLRTLDRIATALKISIHALIDPALAKRRTSR